MGTKKKTAPAQKEREYSIADAAERLENNAAYKRMDSPEKSTMSVREMGRLLGLKKVESYWLVHKNKFETKTIAGKMRVDLESFEKWYANQVKYQKITGEEPGRELKTWTYSIGEVCDILEESNPVVYDLIKNGAFETVTVDYWMRIRKDSFEKWYQGQPKYRKANRKKEKALKAGSYSIVEIAELLGICRQDAYNLVMRNRKWFQPFKIGRWNRVSKDNFYNWYLSQNRYRMKDDASIRKAGRKENTKLAAHRISRQAETEKTAKTAKTGAVGNRKFLTVSEAALLAGVGRKTIYEWKDKWAFRWVRTGNSIRIYRDSFENYLKERSSKDKEAEDGIDSEEKEQLLRRVFL